MTWINWFKRWFWDTGFWTKETYVPFTYLKFFIDPVVLFTYPFVVRYNGLSLIAMPRLDIVVTFFQMIIKAWNGDNKQGLFLLSVLVDAHERGSFQDRISYS